MSEDHVYHLHLIGHPLIHWSVANLPGDTYLKKDDSPSRSHQLPIVSQLGLGLGSPYMVHAEKLTGLIMHRSCLATPAWDHESNGSCHVQKAVSQQLPQFQSFCFLFSDAHWTFGERECETDVSFMADYSRVTHSLHFDKLCSDCHRISTCLANDLGQQAPGHGLVCYMTTDNLRGKGRLCSCSRTPLDGRSRAGGLLLVLSPWAEQLWKHLACPVCECLPLFLNLSQTLVDSDYTAMSLCVDHYPLQMEASVMRCESCTDLWG